MRPDRMEPDELDEDGYHALADHIRRQRALRAAGKNWRPPKDMKVSEKRMADARKRGMI